MEQTSDKATEILSMFADAESNRRKYDDKAVDYYKLYRGYRSRSPKSCKDGLICISR